MFLPYLGGERTPHGDAAVRGALVGLTHASGPAELARAVMQGVAFAFRDSRDALASAGTTLERAYAIGGGARSDWWLSMIATALDLPLDVAADGDYGAGLGAARLGADRGRRGGSGGGVRAAAGGAQRRAGGESRRGLRRARPRATARPTCRPAR